jgi:ABC-type transporter Mla subunit MlaD
VRRLAVIAVFLVALVANEAGIDVTRLAAAIPGSQFFGINAAPSGDYRVDAIFDTAKGIVPGQLVKVAGVRVGTVQDVALTRDFKARVEIAVDPRFAPFRANARCEIRPEGLTAENFVQCEPGSAPAKALVAKGDAPPTVGVAHTTVPVNLNGLFQIWTAPTAERLTLLVNELGIGLAARGDDVNAILRRTNPALGHAQRVIEILSQERDQLARIVDGTDHVSAQLASSPQRVSDFIGQAARLTSTTAAHGRALAGGIQRLPGLLRASAPTLRRLDQFAVQATPTVRSLRRSAAPFSSSLENLRSFATRARPALRGLRTTLARSKPALRRAKPTLARSRKFTAAARPVAPVLSSLFLNLRHRGFIEGTLKLFYYLAAASARFDATSHVLPSELLLNDCAGYSTAPVKGCSAHYYDQASSASSAGARQVGRANSAAVRVGPRIGAKPAPDHGGGSGPVPSSPSPPPASGTPPEVHLPPVDLPHVNLPPLPGLPGAHQHHHKSPVNDLLQYLLG